MLKHNTMMVLMSSKVHNLFSATPLKSQPNSQKFIIASQKSIKSFSVVLTMMLTKLFGYYKIQQDEIDNYSQLFPEDI